MPRRDRDLGQLLAPRAEFVHVARGGERIGGRGQERAVWRLERVDLAHRGLSPPDGSLRRAVGDRRDLAQAELQRRDGVRDMEHEGRAAEDRRVDEFGRDAEIFAEIEAGGTALSRRAEQAVDVANAEAGILGGARDALRHQIDRVEPVGDLAEIRFRRADDRRATALETTHRAPSAGTKTG